MITPANRNAAVIIVNRRRDHEFVIIAPVFLEWTFMGASVLIIKLLKIINTVSFNRVWPV